MSSQAPAAGQADAAHQATTSQPPMATSTSRSQSRGPRSLSRSSFIGRSRVPVGSASEARGVSVASRWRSQSRTVRGSVDETDAFKPDRKTLFDRSRSRSRAPAKSSTPHQPSNKDEADRANARKPRSWSDYEKRFLAWLPRFISRFLGYRDKSSEGKALIPGMQHVPAYLELWIFAGIGAFLSLATIALVFTHAEPFIAPVGLESKPWSGPVIIGSFGASSVLLFGAPASPLGQPWNFVFGQAVSAASGVAIAKLFALNPRFNYESLDASDNLVWVAGGCATALALVLMLVTNSVHPPGGATALLAATTPNVTKLGWRYIATALLSGAIMLAWAMLLMNLGRKRYPTHWINGRTPGTGLDLVDDVVKLFKRPKPSSGATEGKKDDDKEAANPTPSGGDADLEKNGTSNGGHGAQQANSSTPSQQTGSEETLRERLARGAAPVETAKAGEGQRSDGWQDETKWQEHNSVAEDSAERTSRWARS